MFFKQEVFDFAYNLKTKFFYKQGFKSVVTMRAEGAGGRESYPTNDIPNKYIYDAFSMIYLSILLLFFHFSVIQTS